MNWDLALSIAIVVVCFMAVRRDIKQLKPKARSSSKSAVKEDDKQHVYILANPAHRSGLFKIGLTTKGVVKRKAQLYTTGVPSPFTTIMVIETDDCKLVESALHSHFSEKRWNSRREFFVLTYEDLLWISSKYNPSHFDTVEAQKVLRASQSASETS